MSITDSQARIIGVEIGKQLAQVIKDTIWNSSDSRSAGNGAEVLAGILGQAIGKELAKGAAWAGRQE